MGRLLFDSISNNHNILQSLETAIKCKNLYEVKLLVQESQYNDWGWIIGQSAYYGSSNIFIYVLCHHNTRIPWDWVAEMASYGGNLSYVLFSIYQGSRNWGMIIYHATIGKHQYIIDEINLIRHDVDCCEESNV